MNARIMDERDFTMSTMIANDRAKRLQRNVDEFRADTDKQQRLTKLECASCFYFTRGAVAGQGFTRWLCGVCGAEQMHHNTNVPKVCRDCAETHDLCTRCGGDRDMRAGRRKWPETKPTPVEWKADA